MAGAGSLLLLAAAHETTLLATFTAALQPLVALAPRRLVHLLTTALQALLLTLLFFSVAGLRRPWDLRSYTGTMLGLLTSRPVPYSFWTVERLLAFLARHDADQRLSSALSQWTTQLWYPDRVGYLLNTPLYLDSHKKAVYSDVLIPRGHIGKTGKSLGCRTLILIHDAAGHPLSLSTGRGDLHLISGVRQALRAYEQATGSFLRTIIVDREGLGGDFLAAMVDEQRIVVTILRRSQYTDLESFCNVGAFTPLELDDQERVVREVARAQYDLAVPSRPRQPLRLNVALIRDYRQRPSVPDDTDDANTLDAAWWEAAWQPPTPVLTDVPQLIPIVTTGALGDPHALVALYQGRWPAQENVIKDYLLPLGIDVNAGYAKTAVENSEATKKAVIVERRAAKLARQSATVRQQLERDQARAQVCQTRATSATAIMDQVQPVWRGAGPGDRADVARAGAERRGGGAAGR